MSEDKSGLSFKNKIEMLSKIEKLEIILRLRQRELKKLRKDILMFQARYMELLPINKKLRECVEFYDQVHRLNYCVDLNKVEKYANDCLKDIDEKCLEEIEKE